MVQVFPITLIDRQITSQPKNWPAGQSTIKFVCNDAQFTDPNESVSIAMRVSWNGGATWPYVSDGHVWTGGVKSKDGSPLSVTLGPFLRNGVEQRPDKVQFQVAPISGTPSIGLDAEVG